MASDHLDDDGEEQLGEGGATRDGLPVGTLFAERFRIERMLGYGGMGSVYLARDLAKDEHVALKVLKKATLSAESGERFLREVQVLGALQHPGIIAINGFGYAEDGTPWLAMEPLEGETLRDRVKREGPMSARVLAPIVDAASAALSEAHERGVVHRDLKPDHIFLPSTGWAPVKILDFGLSLAVGAKKLTRTGTVLGTPRYMAPEQIASAHAADGQVDVYALGVIVYEALTGHSPFAASDQGQLLGAILQGRIEPLSVKRPDLSPDVVRVVEIAMARTREARWRTPNDLARAFSGAVRGQHVPELDARSRAPAPSLAGNVAARPDAEGVLAAHERGRGGGLRRVLLFVLLVLGALAIVVFGALVSYHLLK